MAFELCNRVYPYPLSLFSQGYHLQTTRDMRPHPSVTLDPATTFHPPPFRSRNQSYMRAVSTLSQASCVSQVSLKHMHCTEATPGDIKERLCYVVLYVVAVCGGALQKRKTSTRVHTRGPQVCLVDIAFSVSAEVNRNN